MTREPRGPRPSPLLVFPEAILSWTNHWIALHKPPGLLSRPGPGHGPSALTQLEGYLAALGSERSRPGVVHRIDRETSGVLLFSLGPAGHRALVDGFARRLIRKEYLAIVRGRPRPQRGRIDLPLRKNSSGAMIPDRNGLPASTRYRTLRSYPGATLLEVQPLTGRMHQIRVHLAARGTPILGDTKYGERWNAREGPGRDPRPPRLCLHARTLLIPAEIMAGLGELTVRESPRVRGDVGPGSCFTISAPEPEDFRSVLLRLTRTSGRE